MEKSGNKKNGISPLPSSSSAASAALCLPPRSRNRHTEASPDLRLHGAYVGSSEGLKVEPCARPFRPAYRVNIPRVGAGDGCHVPGDVSADHTPATRPRLRHHFSMLITGKITAPTSAALPTSASDSGAEPKIVFMNGA